MHFDRVFFTPNGRMNRLFHTAPLDLASWIYVVALSLAAFVIVELGKLIRLRTTR
jgi:hypothetical protein